MIVFFLTAVFSFGNEPEFMSLVVVVVDEPDFMSLVGKRDKFIESFSRDRNGRLASEMDGIERNGPMELDSSCHTSIGKACFVLGKTRACPSRSGAGSEKDGK